MRFRDIEFLRGFGVFASASAVFIVIMLVLAYFSSGGEPLKSSFEVVDKYKECDIVRYECSNVQVSLQDDGQTLKVFLFTTYD